MWGMGIKKDRHSLRGSSPVEIILILMSIGLLIFLALPIYNSFKESGFTSDDPSGEEGNSSGITTTSSLPLHGTRTLIIKTMDWWKWN